MTDQGRKQPSPEAAQQRDTFGRVCDLLRPGRRTLGLTEHRIESDPVTQRGRAGRRTRFDGRREPVAEFRHERARLRVGSRERAEGTAQPRKCLARGALRRPAAPQHHRLVERLRVRGAGQQHVQQFDAAHEVGEFTAATRAESLQLGARRIERRSPFERTHEPRAHECRIPQPHDRVEDLAVAQDDDRRVRADHEAILDRRVHVHVELDRQRVLADPRHEFRLDPGGGVHDLAGSAPARHRVEDQQLALLSALRERRLEVEIGEDRRPHVGRRRLGLTILGESRAREQRERDGHRETGLHVGEESDAVNSCRHGRPAPQRRPILAAAPAVTMAPEIGRASGRERV